MKKYVVVLFAFVALSCVSSKKASFPTTVSLSPSFQMLWSDFLEESKSVKCLENFVPSESFLRKYDLLQENGKYVITGFLLINSEFEQKQFERFGGRIIQQSDEIVTFRFPMSRFDKLPAVKGIKRIELSKNNKLKK